MTGSSDPIDERAPGELSLAELRDTRARLQREDDVVSYVRRVAQARLDLARAELDRRRRGERGTDVTGELREVLSHQLTGGTPRPPRPVDDVGEHELSDELDRICAQHRFSALDTLDESDVEHLVEALDQYERRVSTDRRARFDRLDALSAELVRRYRDGEASVDTLLGDP